MDVSILIALFGANFVATALPGQSQAEVSTETALCGLAPGVKALGGILRMETVRTGLALVTLGAGMQIVVPSAQGLVGGALLALLVLVLFAGASVSADRERPLAQIAAAARFIGLVNPIALVFFLAVLPQATTMSGLPGALLCLAAIIASTALALAAHLVVASLRPAQAA